LAPLIKDLGYNTVAQRQVDCAWAELLLAKGDASGALARLEALEASAPNFEQCGPIARVAKLRGDALAALGRPEQAEAAYEAAATASRRDGRRSLTWRVDVALAGLHLENGDRQAADAAASRARTLVLELAETIEEPDLRQRYLDAALASIPKAESPSGTPNGAGQRLTAREREVAGLVAAGMSNRAIAEALVLSERTVESHVANALAKLGYSSRAQLAVWASENGITGRA
ncbi:MAG TPA: response regulator transcription factor, partial [Dehalococcoidia bacterium]